MTAARRLPGAHGVTLAADAYGDPDAPPVLLLHGGGQTRHAWGGTAKRLAGRGWHALSLDLRGHGESDWSPDGEYGIDPFVADLVEVRRVLGRAPVLVGASLGGLVSLVTEGERAEQGFARALVLVDVAHRIEPSGAMRIIEFMASDLEHGFATLDEAADRIASYLPHRERRADPSGLRKNLRRGPDGRWRWHWDPAFMGGADGPVARGEIAPGPGRILDPERLDRAAEALRLPTLLVRGRMSDVVSEDIARDFLARVPHARFVDVSGAGHMVAGDRNDAFTEAVVGFLAELPPEEAEPR